MGLSWAFVNDPKAKKEVRAMIFCIRRILGEKRCIWTYFFVFSRFPDEGIDRSSWGFDFRGGANYFIRNESGVIDQRIGGGVRFPLPILFTQKVDNSLLRAANNGLLPSDQNGSLKELFVLHENIDDRLWVT